METCEAAKKAVAPISDSCDCKECTEYREKVYNKIKDNPLLPPKFMKMWDMISHLKNSVEAIPLPEEVKTQAKLMGTPIERVPAVSAICFSRFMSFICSDESSGNDINEKIDELLEVFQKEMNFLTTLLKKSPNVTFFN